MATFSVLLLAHNSAWCIKDALDSVIAQTFNDWECLVSDDASQDNTQEIIQPYLGDPRIRYVRHQTNLKQSGNWSYAIQNTSAPFLATLHADDVWLPNTLATYADALSVHSQCDLAIANWQRVTATLQRMAHQPPPKCDAKYAGNEAFVFLLKTNQALPSATAFSRRVALIAGLPFDQYGMLCDRDYLLRLADASKSVSIISVVLAKYRVHFGSVTTSFINSGRLLEEMVHFDERVNLLTSAHRHRKQLVTLYRKSVSPFYFDSAISLQIRGDFQRARFFLERAISYNPAVLMSMRRFVKYLLFQSGAFGRALLRRLHGRNAFVTNPA